MAHISTIDQHDSRWMSVKQAAPILGVSPRTVRRLLAAREVDHYLVGHQIRIDREDLDSYLARTRVNAVS